MNRARLVHVFPTYHTLGGVEAMLRRHYACDERFGVDSLFAISCEQEKEPVPRMHFLDLNESMTVGTARKRMKSVVGGHHAEVVAYHGMHWLHHFADVDGAQRRILVLHVDTPGWPALLRKCEKWVDGILCVSKPQLKNLVAAFPQFSGGRSEWLPYSIDPPANLTRRHDDDGVLVLGVCGRLVIEQKRIDRLPTLCAALDRSGLNYRLEILGNGPDRAWLEERLPNRNRFYFHGRKTGADYWHTLAGWDCLLSVTDYEGTSIALLEAMSIGVVPVAPRVGSGGDEYVAAVERSHLYEPGDFDHVALVLKTFQQLNVRQQREMQERARQAVAAHIGDGYIKTFAEFVQKIWQMPKMAARYSLRARALSGVSFATLGRLAKLRSRFR